jgi:hypothetical protein
MKQQKITRLKRYSYTQSWKTKIDNYFIVNLVSVPPLEENLGDAHCKICIGVIDRNWDMLPLSLDDLLNYIQYQC